MSTTPTIRVIDASLNRAGEGLRVIEDFVRFVLDDAHLARISKDLRHELALLAAQLDPAERSAARDTLRDVGASIKTPAEAVRTTPYDVCTASLNRVQQSLRSLEEFGKLQAPTFAAAAEAMRYRMYTLEKAIQATQSGLERLADARLYVLIEGAGSASEFAQSVSSLVEAGVDVLQLRDKGLTDRVLLERAKQLVELTRGGPVLAIINDRPDISVLAGADGVHLGQDELTVKDARTIVGARQLIGVSTHSIEQARQAVLHGASYLGCGPTFPSRTKEFAEFPGLRFLSQVAREIRLPAFAIGGVTEERLDEVLATGAGRVALAAGVTRAADPAAAAARISARLRQSGAR